MLTQIYRLFGLLLGITILLSGMGLLGSLLGLRATLAHFEGWELGLVMSGYYAGYIIGTFSCPTLIRRVGPIRSFAAFAAVAAGTTLAHGLTINPWSWLVLRLIGGTAMVGLFIITESWLNAKLARAWRVQMFSLYATLTLVAMAAGQFLLFAQPADNAALFLIAGILVIAGLIPVTATSLNEPEAISAPRLPSLSLLARAPFAIAGTFFAGLLTGAFWGLAAAFATRLGLTPGQAGAFVACATAGGVVTLWPLGRLSDRAGRRPVIVISSCIGAVLALLLSLAASIPMWLLFVFAFGFGAMAFGLYALSVAYMNDRVDPHEVLPATQVLLLSTGIGSMFGPLIAGAMFDAAGTRGLPWYFAIVLGALALAGVLSLRRQPRLAAEEHGRFVSMVRTSQVGLEMAEEPRNVEAAAETSGATATR